MKPHQGYAMGVSLFPRVTLAKLPLMVNWESVQETCESLWSNFFSAAVGGIMALATVVTLVGTLRLMSSTSNGLNVLLFLAMLLAFLGTVFYLVLLFIHRKPFRLMYGLSAGLVLSVLFNGLAFGVTAPTVQYCNGDVIQAGSSVLSGLVNSTKSGQVNGALGRSLGSCADNTTIFAATVVLAVAQIVAVFDVQRLLLRRIVAKSYGDRFQEMGIK